MRLIIPFLILALITVPITIDAEGINCLDGYISVVKDNGFSECIPICDALETGKIIEGQDIDFFIPPNCDDDSFEVNETLIILGVLILGVFIGLMIRRK